MPIDVMQSAQDTFRDDFAAAAMRPECCANNKLTSQGDESSCSSDARLRTRNERTETRADRIVIMHPRVPGAGNSSTVLHGSQF
jgi:hypothetical protein